MRLIVCYDITKSSVRTKFARACEKVLDRVQWSVFEGETDGDGLDFLRDAADTIIDHETDTVRFYRPCASCGERTLLVGTAAPVREDQPEEII
ncbi:MAG: CRISPR-associated endonuclease Cas2 [Acidobacteriota bacterium]